MPRSSPAGGVSDVSQQPFIIDTPAVTWTPHRPARPPKSEGGRKFKLVAPYKPAGDQPTAIAELVDGIRRVENDQVLLGVTGSGKTFTMASIIAATQRPALILAPNKTLAAQLYSEFKSFFPDNAVEYFVSYYDYYQPEAYVPRTDTYVDEKDSSLNEQIDQDAPLGHPRDPGARRRDRGRLGSAASTASVSVETYTAMTFELKVGDVIDEGQAARRPGGAGQHKRNDAAFDRGTFRKKGDVKFEIFLAHYEDRAWRPLPVRRRDRVDPGVRPPHRQEDPPTSTRSEGLRRQPLRHPAPDPEPGRYRHSATS